MFLMWVIPALIIYYFWKEKQVTTEQSSDILKRRFVNGEIDEATYQRMKSIIKE